MINYFQVKYGLPIATKNLKEKLLEADELYLATDEDREGEAIAWHLVSALELAGKSKTKGAPARAAKPTERIVFHEITKDAILSALVPIQNAHFREVR